MIITCNHSQSKCHLKNSTNGVELIVIKTDKKKRYKNAIYVKCGQMSQIVKKSNAECSSREVRRAVQG